MAFTPNISSKFRTKVNKNRNFLYDTFSTEEQNRDICKDTSINDHCP